VAKINHLAMPSQLCESPRKF